MPLTIYTGGAKGVDTHVERVCHLYESFVCGPHPTLSPSSQVPHALDSARL